VVQVGPAATSPVAPPAAPATPPQPIATTAPSAPPAPSANAPEASEGESIGVPECDRYIKALDACAAKRLRKNADYEQSKAKLIKAARDVAKGPGGKAEIKTLCTASADSLEKCP
jgi:hypothetical protein